MQNPESQLRIASRRAKVATLFLQGVRNQFDLCARLGMEHGQHSTISRDLKAIRDDWKRSAVRDYDADLGRQLAKLDALEAEYWAAWERSKLSKDSERKRQQTRDGATTNEAEFRKTKRDGEAKFLEGVRWCVREQNKLLGLYPEGDDPGRAGATAAVPVLKYYLPLPAPNPETVTAHVLSAETNGHGQRNYGPADHTTDPDPDGPPVNGTGGH